MLKKWAFLITIVYSLALASVCLISFKKLPDLGVSFSDKLFHVCTYVILAFLWFYTCLFHFKTPKMTAICYASLIAIIFGIIIEVLQGVLTSTRQADVYDVLANSLGVLLGASVLWLLKNRNTVKKL